MFQSKILAKYTNLFHYFGDRNDTHLIRMYQANTLVRCEQVHGNKVAVQKDDKNRLIRHTDGLMTDKPLTLAIHTADCLPIFFYEPNKKIVAAIHAGWKGLLSGILKKTVKQMGRIGAEVKNIDVAIGPHIKVCCYDVPKERVEKFKMTNRCYSSHLSQKVSFGVWRKDKWYLDLGKIALLQLNSLGIKDSNIEISDICTSCDINYWSFRRDGKNCGRMLNIIGITDRN